ncbi:hypothetical protein D3C76_928250 [compost metagenome]
MHIVLSRVQLADDLDDALRIGCRFRDHHCIGRHGRPDIAVDRDQRPDQPGDIGGTAIVQLDHSSDKLRGRSVLCSAAASASPGFCHWRDQDAVTLVDHREVVGVEHPVEQAADAFAIKGLPRHNGDASGDPGIEHHGGPQNAGDFFNDVAQLSVVHRQLPLFLSCLQRARQSQTRQHDKETHRAQGLRANETVHYVDYSDGPETGRRKRVETAGACVSPADSSFRRNRATDGRSVSRSSRPLFHSTT